MDLSRTLFALALLTAGIAHAQTAEPQVEAQSPAPEVATEAQQPMDTADEQPSTEVPLELQAPAEQSTESGTVLEMPPDGQSLEPTPSPAPRTKKSPTNPGDRPSRGTSMEQVEATFGEPTERIPAVGEPPIARWVYADYTVYFEGKYVIHTVEHQR